MKRAQLVPEWSRQSAIFLAWPYAEGDFGPWLTDVIETYVKIAEAVLRYESLIVACRNESHRSDVETILSGHGIDPACVRFVLIRYDDVWVRDTAPLSVMDHSGVRLLDFRFNGWGGKYEHSNDARIARSLHASGLFGETLMDSVDFVLEGGSIEVDGEGTVMTTSRCLLNPNRNPEYSKDKIEEQLAYWFGADRVIWLEHGHAEGDDTDAHIDTLARFCSADTIAYTACDQPDDPLFNEFDAMAKQLASIGADCGKDYRLVPLPMPAPIRSETGDRLPATYANFLIINDAVLVPVYGDPADRVALERLSSCFPDRDLVPIDCVPLIRQYGSLHCMTMQFPAALKITEPT